MRIVSFVGGVAVLIGSGGVRAQRSPQEPQLLVIASPGSPGTTEEAQPRMDALAKALSTKTGVPLAAVYDPSDAGGAKRMERAGLAIVSLPFFLEHEKQFGLHARLQVVQKGRPALERWALVARKGRIAGAASLAGWTIVSTVAFAPRFVRGPALGAFGKLPADVKLVQSVAVLSSLRRAAAGEPIAVLLDGTQEASLASLPFASQLEVVTRSPAMPAGLVVTVDSRLPAKAWNALGPALLGLGSDPSGTTALDAVELARFEPVDDRALAIARTAYASAP